MLLVFIAFIAMLNYVLTNFIGDITGINTWVQNFTNGQYKGLSLEFILGYTLAPLTWLLGVCKEDIVLVGQLLGEKTILNEFVAYVSLGELKASGKFFEEKSIIIATYILCGFANFCIYRYSDWWHWSNSTFKNERLIKIRYNGINCWYISLFIYGCNRRNDNIIYATIFRLND